MKERRISRGVLTILIAVTVLFATAFAYGFSDVEETNSLASDIGVLVEKGYVAGYPDGTFRPAGHITRAEFVRMVNSIFGYLPGTLSNHFVDVQEGSWYYGDVLAGLQAGYIIGYPDGTFRPQGNITKEEACAIFDRILSLDLHIKTLQMESIVITDEISPWANNSVRRVLVAGIMKPEEDKTFQSKRNILRGQVVYACARVLEKLDAKLYSPIMIPGMPSTPLTEYDIMVNRTIASVTDIINDNVLPENRLSSGDIERQKIFLQELCSNMQHYLDTTNKEDFDADAIAANMKVRYSSLSPGDREELKRVIPANVDIIDLSKLRSFFGF